jgi:hypothetical protein
VFAAARIAQWIVDQLASAISEPGHVTLTATGSPIRLDNGRTLVEVDVSAFGEHGILASLDTETATRAALSTIQDSVA